MVFREKIYSSVETVLPSLDLLDPVPHGMVAACKFDYV